MARHPEVTIITSSLLILVGLSLLAQGVNENFPDSWFGVGIAIAFVLMLLYKKHRLTTVPLRH